MSRMDVINNGVGYWVGKSASGDGRIARISACQTLLARVRNGTRIDGEADPFAEFKRLGFGSSNFENSFSEVIKELIWRRLTDRTGTYTVQQYSTANDRYAEIRTRLRRDPMRI
jgi:hypothetical protein